MVNHIYFISLLYYSFSIILKYIRKSITMKITTILLFTTFLFSSVYSKCNGDQLSCFQNKLFNFGSPSQNIYYLPQITELKQSKELNIIAYGDFNNDLHTDFVALNLKSNQLILVYSWNPSLAAFSLSYTLNSTICPVSSIYLYDIDLNGILDVVAWGLTNNLNCILPFLQLEQGSFSQGGIILMNPSPDPFVISFGTNNVASKTVGLLAFLNGSRTILKYELVNQNFLQIEWSKFFNSTDNYSNVSFADPHWNSFLDLTGDCFGDIVIINERNQVEFWTYNSNGKIFILQNSINQVGLVSLSFADMNYDGLVDLIKSYQSYLSVNYNLGKLKNEKDFCVPGYESVSFNQSSNAQYIFPQGYIMKPGNLQIKDLNIDGYPDFLLTLFQSSSNNYSIIIPISYQGKQFNQNNQYKLPNQNFKNVISASFIDFWENGIIDFIVCTENGILSYYNNYLQQNLFFIKGYGASGQNTTHGSQIIGASFYWINSVGDGYRTTVQSQIIQTGYNALQTPYSYCGLGRANNYVQSFTLGIYGIHHSWSPIIPNSQLAVYAQGGNQNQWAIRIFVLPTQSLVYVIIVSIFVLVILGGVLIGLKCKNYKKKEEPFMQFIH